MKYSARIGYLDRYTGTDYEVENFEAENDKDAEKKARKIANLRAYQIHPDTFFIDKVWRVS